MTSDTYIMTGIISSFIILGVVLPFINAEFGSTDVDLNVDGLTTNTGQSSTEGGLTQATTTGISVLLSVLLMFFWTFGAVPFWLEAILLIMRIVLVITIFRTARGN